MGKVWPGGGVAREEERKKLMRVVRHGGNTLHIRYENTYVDTHVVLTDWVVFILARCQVPFAIFELS
jgi:hypothetical protein